MIITRTPLRISFVGGGTDLPEFYERSPGAVLSASIDKYIYLMAHPFFKKDQIHLKYSKTELVSSPEAINHPIFREVFMELGMKGIEISSTADIPSGTGLGSSSSFTVGLYHCLNAYGNNYCNKAFLAEKACELEIQKLKEPIGKQDQYAAAFGGLNLIRFEPNGNVLVEPVLITKDRLRSLEKNLLMFYTGDIRSAKSILNEQKNNTINSKVKFDTLKQMMDQVSELKKILEKGQLDDLGYLLDDAWKLKKSMASSISNKKINFYYNLAVQEGGALGGKLLGAGGGGFLLFYAISEKHDQLRHALKELREVNFSISQNGSELILYDQHD
jgi:D-glycero-alpha-D-manno-heptose-7-phosphate kinase